MAAACAKTPRTERPRRCESRMLVSTRGCYDKAAHECQVFFPVFRLNCCWPFWSWSALPRTRAEGQAASQNQQPAAQQQQPDQNTPEAGGPSGDTGVIAVPKKKENPDAAPPPPAPAAPQFKNPEGLGNVTLHVNVPEVTIDVGVLVEKTHQFVPGLKPSNFRVYEDGVEQKVEGFKRTEAPITALILMEYAARGWIFRIAGVERGLGVCPAVAARRTTWP